MKKYVGLAVLAMLGLTACEKKDAVPKVDLHGTIKVVEPARVENGFHFPERRVRMIDVNGEEMPLRDFIIKYCQTEASRKDDTCIKANKIKAIDTSSGPKENLPKGL